MSSYLSTKKELFNLPEVITSESGYLIDDCKDLSLIANGLFSVDNKNLRKVNNLRCADVLITFDENTHMASMSCQTVSADIYYTLDGSDPDSSKTKYNGSILIDNNCTIKVVALRDGLEPSGIVSKTVKILPVVEQWREQQNIFIINYYTSYTNDTDAVMMIAFEGLKNIAFGNSNRFAKVDVGENKSLSYQNPVLVDHVRLYEMDDAYTKRLRGWDFQRIWPITRTEYVGTPLDAMQLYSVSIRHTDGLVTINANYVPAEVEHIYYRIDDGEYQEYTEPFQMTVSGTVTAYSTGTGYEDSAVNSIEVTLPPSVGDIVSVDGIETLVLAVKDDSGAWVSTAGARGTECIGVDRNHDLSYYIKGSDYVDSNDYEASPGTFGYEWGGYNTEIGIQDTTIGTGLANTNALIGMNLQPNTSGWWVVWDKVNEFRQNHSDKWFVPSLDELDLVNQQKANLSNISTTNHYFYWSSSEFSSRTAWSQSFSGRLQGGSYKYTHRYHTRLCVQFNASDAEMKV